LSIHMTRHVVSAEVLDSHGNPHTIQCGKAWEYEGPTVVTLIYHEARGEGDRHRLEILYRDKTSEINFRVERVVFAAPEQEKGPSLVG